MFCPNVKKENFIRLSSFIVLAIICIFQTFLGVIEQPYGPAHFLRYNFNWSEEYIVRFQRNTVLVDKIFHGIIQIWIATYFTGNGGGGGGRMPAGAGNAEDVKKSVPTQKKKT